MPRPLAALARGCLPGVLAAVLAACASPSKSPESEPPATTDESKTSSRTTIRPGGSDTIRLPGDTVLAVKIHPRRFAKLLEAAPPVPEGRWSALSEYVPTAEEAARSALYQTLPQIFAPADISSSTDVYDGLRRALAANALVGANHGLDHLDPSRYVVVALWTAEQRRALRRIRLGLSPGSRAPTESLRATVYYPTNRPAKLRRELKTACSRHDVDERSPEEDYPMPDLCGSLDAFRTTDTRLAVHGRYRGVYFSPARGENRPDTSGGSQLPDTPARRAFETSDAAVSAYTTATGLAKLSTVQTAFLDHGTGWGTPQTAPPGAYLEYVDLAVSIRGDGAGGFAADIHRSRTTLGRDILRRATDDGGLPRLDVPNQMFRLARNWNADRAARAAERPRWVHAATNPKGEVELDTVNREFGDSVYWPLQALVAYPSAYYGLAGETDFEDEISPFRRYAPNSLRAGLGTRTDENGETRPTGALVADFSRDVADRLQPRLDDYLAGLNNLLGIEFQSAWRARGDEVRLFVHPKNRTLEEVFGADAGAPAVARLRADLSALTERLSAKPASNVPLAEWLTNLEAARLSTRQTSRGSAMRLHLGGGDLPSLRLPETDSPPLEPTDSPPCFSELVRRSREFRGHPPEKDRWHAFLREMEANADRCELSGRMEHDVRILRRTVRGRTGHVALRSGALEGAVPHFEAACELDRRSACRFAQSLPGFELPKIPAAHAGLDALSAPTWGNLLTPGGLFPVDGRPCGRAELSKRVVDEWLRPFEFDLLANIRGRENQRGTVELLSAETAAPADLAVGLGARAVRTDSSSLHFAARTSDLSPGRRGLVAVRPADDIAPPRRVQITARGFQIVGRNGPLPPVDGCDDSGPTVCVRHGDPAARKLLGRYRDSLDGPLRRTRNLANQIVERYRWRALHEALVDLRDRSDEGPVLAVETPPKFPFGLAIRAIGEGLFRFEQPTDGTEGASARTTVADALFPRPTVELADPTQPDLSRARGHTLFRRECGRCHGADARGTDYGPPIADSEYLDRPADLVDIVRAGSAAPQLDAERGDDDWMPPTRLRSPQDLAMLVNYLHLRFGDGERELPVATYEEWGRAADEHVPERRR